MSYHILHIADYGCKLTKERGLLVCKKNNEVIGKIAIEDLRAVVLLYVFYFLQIGNGV